MGLGATISTGGIADAELAEAAALVVEERLGEPTRFTLHYSADTRDGEPRWVGDRRLDPGSEIMVVAAAPDGAACLVKGPVLGHRIRLKHGGAGSVLEVRGADSSVKMDHDSRATVWSGVTDSEAVLSIVAGYGFVPDVASTPSRHLEQGHTLVQRATDLRFVQRMARRNGLHFWVRATPHGIETAHFRSPRLDGEPEVKIRINRDPPGTLELEIEWDIERPTAVEARQLDLSSKNQIDGSIDASPLAALGDRRLAELAGTRTLHLPAPGDDAGDLRARAEGVLAEADWFIRARCETSVETLGTVVRPAMLAEIAGAGTRHSGNYLVAGVTHVIDDVAHRMTIDLIRNAWGGSNGAGLLAGLL
jgi:phage protein D